MIAKEGTASSGGRLLLLHEGRRRRKESREPCRAMERGENITAMRTRFERGGEEIEGPQLLLTRSMQVPLPLTPPNLSNCSVFLRHRETTLQMEPFSSQGDMT